MRPVFAALLYATCGLASSADFRGLDLGSQCSAVPSHEVGLGSKVAAGEGRGGDKYQIRAVYLGREAEVVYNCDSDGRLRGGMYIYDFGTYEAASTFYIEIRSKLLDTLGMPYQDSMSPDFAEAMRRVEMPIFDWNRYMAMWAFDTHTISISATRRVKDLPESWVIVRYRSK